jgi:hypothetical protein
MNVVVHQTLGRTESKPAKLSNKGRRTRQGKHRLLNREALDGRTIVAKVFDKLVCAIHQDLGGDQLSAIETCLVEAFAGSAVALDNLNTKIITGEPITNAMVAMHAQTVSAMVRVANKLGTGRRAKTVPSLNEWLTRKARDEGRIPEGEIMEGQIIE